MYLQNVEIASLKEVRKVKSIQIFRKSAQKAIQGDRAGICVTQFDSSLLERGLVCNPGVLPSASAIIIELNKIRFHKSDISTGSKYHISVGHSTILSTITLFYTEDCDNGEFNFENQYAFAKSHSEIFPSKDEETDANEKKPVKVYALIEFEHVLVIPPNGKIVGSRLDADVHTTSCRLAFEGKIVHTFVSEKYRSEDLVRLKVFKLKEKSGLIERVNNDHELIGKNMFKKETNIHLFDGFKVKLSTGEIGKMDGPFGKSGKFKVSLNGTLKHCLVHFSYRKFRKLKHFILDSISEETKVLLGGKKKKEVEATESSKVEVTMAFKKYIFSKVMSQ